MKMLSISSRRWVRDDLGLGMETSHAILLLTQQTRRKEGLDPNWAKKEGSLWAELPAGSWTPGFSCRLPPGTRCAW